MPGTTARASALEIRRDGAGWRERLGQEVRTGLTESPRWVPSQLFYDAAGSALFERITELPEYYQTRTERGLLRAHAREVVARVGGRDIVELGPGGPGKIRILLDGLEARLTPLRYVPLDVDAAQVEATARALADDHPALHVQGIAGDFLRDLSRVPTALGGRLVLFLGGTIGNLHPGPRRELLVRLRGLLEGGGGLLLGLDLVKAPRLLHMAYNDLAGVTAAFNRNILRVVNREFRATFRPALFHHRAFYDAAAGRVEMHLMAATVQEIRVRALDLEFELEAGESLWTESSYKFTRESASAMLEEAGFRLARWYTDPDALFALALAEPR
jgi:L-histidine N-alpha-methyltransferase